MAHYWHNPRPYRGLLHFWPVGRSVSDPLSTFVGASPLTGAERATVTQATPNTAEQIRSLIAAAVADSSFSARCVPVTSAHYHNNGNGPTVREGVDVPESAADGRRGVRIWDDVWLDCKAEEY